MDGRDQRIGIGRQKREYRPIFDRTPDAREAGDRLTGDVEPVKREFAIFAGTLTVFRKGGERNEAAAIRVG